MKNILFYTTILITLIVFTKNVYSQELLVKEEVIFIFNSKTDFTDKFVDRTNKKILNFIIKGIKSPEQKQELINKFKVYRGVVDFQINDKLEEGKYEAVISLYEYADHWMYYKFLFMKNGINKIEIAGEIIESEKLSEL